MLIVIHMRKILAQVICTKVRDGDKRIVRLKEGNAKGRHIVIMDDLVQSGSTLLECGKLLKAQVDLPSAFCPAPAHMCACPTVPHLVSLPGLLRSSFALTVMLS